MTKEETVKMINNIAGRLEGLKDAIEEAVNQCDLILRSMEYLPGEADEIDNSVEDDNFDGHESGSSKTIKD